MSQENVEIVRCAHERFNVGDIEGFLELCASDIEFRDLPSLPGSGVFVGHEAIRGWWAQLYDAFDDLRFNPEEFLDAGERVSGAPASADVFVLELRHPQLRGRSISYRAQPEQDSGIKNMDDRRDPARNAPTSFHDASLLIDDIPWNPGGF